MVCNGVLFTHNNKLNQPGIVKDTHNPRAWEMESEESIF